MADFQEIDVGAECTAYAGTIPDSELAARGADVAEVMGASRHARARLSAQDDTDSERPPRA